MSLTAGIVGLPNVGKSTLFNAITKSKVLAENYPFATIEPNVGIVEINPRVDELVKIYNPRSVVRTTFSFTDIAGLVKGQAEAKVSVTSFCPISETSMRFATSCAASTIPISPMWTDRSIHPATSNPFSWN